MEITLRSGKSQVKVNSHGGFFNWYKAGRPVMPLVEGSGRQSHASGPVFSLPTGPLPGATQPMERHGFIRTSDLTVLSKDDSSISLELASPPTARIDALYAQYPFDFIIRQNLCLINENLLHFSLTHQNLSAEPAKVDLALNPCFSYNEKESEGVLLPLRERVYLPDRKDPSQYRYLNNPAFKGELIDRDWGFSVDCQLEKLPNPFFVCYEDGTAISLDVGKSDPAVSHFQVWTEPAQGVFFSVQPVIFGHILKPGATALLDVLISLKEPRL
jgi:galactose mutarotase-like enzyme